MIRYGADQNIIYPLISAPANEGGGVTVSGLYNPEAFPTIILIAPDKSIVEKDMWPASTIPGLLEDYEILATEMQDNFSEALINHGSIVIDSYHNNMITFSTSKSAKAFLYPARLYFQIFWLKHL